MAASVAYPTTKQIENQSASDTGTGTGTEEFLSCPSIEEGVNGRIQYLALSSGEKKAAIRTPAYISNEAVQKPGNSSELQEATPLDAIPLPDAEPKSKHPLFALYQGEHKRKSRLAEPSVLSHYGKERMLPTYVYEGETSTAAESEPNIRRSDRRRSLKSIGDYQISKTIGSGSTGKVKLGINLRTHEQVAVKIIPRKQLNPSKPTKETIASKEARILREAAILNLLHHPNIVQLRDMYISEDHFILLFEHINGGQLLDYIISHGKLREKVARRCFRQLLSAVDYCHRNSIVHRDLKIENALISQDGTVKLIDFGLSNFYDRRDYLQTFCGSLYFAAPELLCGKVYTGPEVDIWSLGIVLYVLVCGKVPFDHKSISRLHELIKAGKLEYPRDLSHDLKHLLARMIDIDPGRRANLNEAMNHPWTNKGFSGPVSNHVPDRRPLDGYDDHVIQYISREFGAQYEYSEIISILEQARRNWAAVSNHPVVSLYFLAKEKAQRDALAPRTLTGTSAPPERIGVQLSAPEQAVLSKPKGRHASHGISIQPIKNVLFRQHKEHSAEKDQLILSEPPHEDSSKDTNGASVPLPEDLSSKPKGFGFKHFSITGKKGRSDNLPTENNYQAIEASSTPDQGFKNLPIAHGHTRSTATATAHSYSSGAAPLTHSSVLPEIPLPVKTVYVRGIFSVNTTSVKSPHLIRDQILRVLDLNRIRYEDHATSFLCLHQASVSPRSDAANNTSEPSPVQFEIHIVRLALLGLYGVQFRRLSGDFSNYKNMCRMILSELSL